MVFSIPRLGLLESVPFFAFGNGMSLHNQIAAALSKLSLGDRVEVEDEILLSGRVILASRKKVLILPAGKLRKRFRPPPASLN
jgi:hypothetical protein